MCYNILAGYSRTSNERGCTQMGEFISFLYAVMANVIARYICKWLDGRK